MHLTIVVEEAQTILNNAWRILDPMVRDSMVKLNLRAFSWYVLDRHLLISKKIPNFGFKVLVPRLGVVARA
ncbi:MAG: hypothetical protein R2777_04940 [Chitinophagales bacterium]